MSEVDEAAKIISTAADPDANIIFGATIDEAMRDQIKITVIATGFDEAKQRLKDLSQPITSRRQESVYQSAPPAAREKEIIEEEKEDIFDIPAFLRQRN